MLPRALCIIQNSQHNFWTLNNVQKNCTFLKGWLPLSAQERLIRIIKMTRSWRNNSFLSAKQLLIMRMNWKRSSKTTRLSGKERQHWSNSPLQCGSTANNNPKHTCDQFSYYCLLAYFLIFVFLCPIFLEQCVHDLEQEQELTSHLKSSLYSQRWCPSFLDPHRHHP